MEKTKQLNKPIEIQLEQIARAIPAVGMDHSAESVLERDIALTISQIDSTRDLTNEQEKDIDVQLLELGSELLRLKPRPLTYVDHLYRDRLRLMSTLGSIHAEKRRLKAIEQEKINRLHSHLLSLINDRITLQYGNPSNS